MPKTPCLCLAIILMVVSCQKEQEPLPKLVSFNDTDHKYSVAYNGSQVSEIRLDSGAGAPYVLATYTYSKNFIRASLHENTGYSRIDYYLKNGSLPYSIRKYKLAGGYDSLVSRVDFYYRSSDNMLDSVVLEGTTHYNFIPVFSGGNITDYSISTSYGPPIPSGSFLYYPIANVFKATNPLLFIYSSPVFQFETFLLPRLFSAGTMKKFNGGSFVYNTDEKGNLSMEDYGTIYPYKRTYLYK